jgi:hypothetical protein
MSGKATGNLIIYQTEDGHSKVECRLVDESIWLSQALMGELFDRSKKTISEHLQNLFGEGELNPDSVVRNFRTTAADGKSYDVAHYNLEAILAVGFRVKSPRGTQFRRWANTQLREFIVKGFVMDDERLKNPGGWDYFDELLARIREIRASEKRFYQKVRDLFALSSDYHGQEKQTRLLKTTGRKPQMPQMGADAWVADWNLRKSVKSAVIKRVWVQPQMPQMNADAWVAENFEIFGLNKIWRCRK